MLDVFGKNWSSDDRAEAIMRSARARPALSKDAFCSFSAGACAFVVYV
jgi:hypothetical protein